MNTETPSLGKLVEINDCFYLNIQGSDKAIPLTAEQVHAFQSVANPVPRLRLLLGGLLCACLLLLAF